MSNPPAVLHMGFIKNSNPLFQGGKWRFELLGKTDGYLTVGLSDNLKMGDDLTSSCIVNPGTGDGDVL
jgi:hypothetical protein